MSEFAEESTELTRGEKNVTLLIATLGSFLTPFMSSSINIALPSIGKEFAAGTALLNWVTTSYLLATAVFLVPFGKLADIYGRKRIYFLGISIYTISALALGLSTTLFMLLFFRVVQGLGSAMIFGTGVAILTSVFPAGERGKALGLNVAAIYLGLSLGPFLGGFLTQNFGWRSIFLSSVPLGVLCIFFILWKLKREWAEAEGERFDLLGSVIYGFSLLFVMYGFSRLPAVFGFWLILGGIGGLFSFAAWEMRQKNPVLQIKLFRHNRVFSLSSLAALINYSATFAVGYLLSLYLQYIKDMTPQVAGIVLVAQPVMQVIFSPVAGRLSDRIEPQIVASLGMSITALGLLLFAFLSGQTALSYVIISLMTIGFGISLFSSPNMNAIMGSVERRFYGIASGTLGTMRLVGQMLSMGLAMLVFSTNKIGGVEITPRYYPAFLTSVRVTFTIMTVLCVVGIFTSLARGKMHG